MLSPGAMGTVAILCNAHVLNSMPLPRLLYLKAGTAKTKTCIINNKKPRSRGQRRVIIIYLRHD